MVQIGHVPFERDFVLRARRTLLIRPVDRNDVEALLLATPVGPNANPRKEGGKLVELFPLPMIGRMVVALGALNLNAQENPRDFGGGVVGIGRLGHDQRRGAVLAHVAGRRDDRFGDLVPVLVPIQGIGHPDD